VRLCACVAAILAFVCLHGGAFASAFGSLNRM
jgi:hypothetical protein